MPLAIELQNVSKLYRLGETGTGAFVHDLNKWWHKVRGKEDPYLRIGQVNDRASGNKAQYVWALRDISFEVEKGDIVGIIGKNGAGKSTLLKILSKVTGPTTGSISYNGRIASLLEVGTGFHPELTGIENVYMNGTILGMKRHEVKRKLDEILDFAGVAMYADTPVKRYSSGMTLRLAFAVAANLESEILIVDEVLAVGDAEFQKKAIGKMQDVSQNTGKTVLFVSHNLPTLKSLCRSGILIENGSLKKTGTIDEVITEYTLFKKSGALIRDKIKYFNSFFFVHSISINNQETCSVQLEGQKLSIEADIEFGCDTKFELDVHLTKNEVAIAAYSNFVFRQALSFTKGRYCFRYEIDLPELKSDLYSIDLYFTDPYVSWLAICLGNIELEYVNSRHDTFLNASHIKWGSILLEGNISYEKKS